MDDSEYADTTGIDLGGRTTNRRRVLQGLGAVGLGSSVSGLAAAGGCDDDRGADEIPIATQFWTYNNSDLSVAELIYESANAGYDAVEPFTLNNDGDDEGVETEDVDAIAAALEETGMELSSAHVGIEQLEEDLEGTVETYSEFGADALVHAYKGEGTWESEESIVEWAERVNEMADAVADATDGEMTFGYHNHDQEFRTFDGEFGFDIFAEHLDDEVHLQLDVGWALVGGADPVAVLERHSDKIRSLHMKDMTEDGEFTEIGEGDVDMEALANVARGAADVDYLIYEYDGAPEPVDSLYYGAQFLERVNGPRDRDGVPSEAWPPRVVPGDDGLSGDPPSDATILWDGEEATLDGWEHTGNGDVEEGGDAEWTEHDDYFAVDLGTGDIRTEEALGDSHLHVEWRTPEEYAGYVDVEEGGDGQTPGNSGVFLMETYEIQVLQSHDNPTYPSGYAGSFYLASPEGGAVPLALPIEPPGEWNAYDIVWRGPRFEDGDVVRYPQLTVFFNGVAVINHFDVPGPNWWVDLFADEFDNDTNPHPQDEDGNFLQAAPLQLQDHGAETDEVHYRNIWYRDLPEYEGPDELPEYDSSRGVWEEREEWPDRDSATDPEHPDHPEQIDPGGPGTTGEAPGDADVLIDGDGLDAWESVDGCDPGWNEACDYVEVDPGTGDIRTETSYGDAQFHVEYRIPEDAAKRDSGKGNGPHENGKGNGPNKKKKKGSDAAESGVLMMGQYEIQIADTYMNPVDPDEWAGAYVDQSPPHHDAVRRPGEWQQLDIVWQGPRFEDGELAKEAQTTVFLNGVAVQTRLVVEGPNADGSLGEYEEHASELPLRLQDAGSRVQFRNTWVRSLD